MWFQNWSMQALRFRIIGALTTLSFLFCVSIAMAHATAEGEMTCPVCGTKFTTIMDISGYNPGERLDLKPLDPIAVPKRIPVCPKCSFVLYEYDLPNEEREKLRGFLKSPQYQQLLAQKHTSYFLLARILTFMDYPSFDVAYAYLKASWQVEQLDSKRYFSYLESCLASLRGLPEDGKEWTTAQVLIGEILRLLGKFDEAHQHFMLLLHKPEFKKEPYRTYISIETELISSKDRSPRKGPDIVLTEGDHKERPGYKMCLRLEGVDNVKKLFSIENSNLGWFSLLPYSLLMKLAQSGDSERLVNAARWYNPIDEQNNEAQYNWNDFIKIYTEVNAVVSQHQWLSDWRATSRNRSIEAEIFGIRPHSEYDLDTFVTPAWKHAGLKGKPYYEVTLRRGAKWCGTVFFGREDSRALVVTFYPGDGEHWLDKIDSKVFYHFTQKVPEYLVIEPTGKWFRNSRENENPHQHIEPANCK